MKELLMYNKRLKANARGLRTHMTDCESKLWGRLRGKQLSGLQFYRQKPLADFIVDFYCPSAKLVVEVDGGQHFVGTVKKSDQIRDQRLQSLGLRVVRISDLDVIHNIEAVLEMIHNVLREKISPSPSFQKRGEGR